MSRCWREGITSARRARRSLVRLFVLLIASLVAPAAFADGINLDLVSFGVGNHARPGDWVGIKVGLQSNLPEAVQVEVQWEIENADGDITENTRTAALSPGQRLERWIYGKLPPGSNAADVVGNRPYSIRVFEVADGRRVRELASTRISGDTAKTPTAPVELEQDLILVIGNRRLGLDAYAVRPNNFAVLPSLAYVTRIASGATTTDLPDHWQGLAQFQSIVWADAAQLPSALTGDQAAALREWVNRGGTLVLGIPIEDRDIWSIGRTGIHPLEDLLPSKAPKRIEAVPLSAILPLLSKSDQLARPNAVTALAVFDPAQLDRGWKPFLAMPSPKAAGTRFLVPRPDSLDGKVIGLQRNYGFGQIILLGVDVDGINGRGLQVQPMPQGDIFWNRILGRRGDTPSLEDCAKLAEANPPQLVTTIGNSMTLGDGNIIAGQIGLTGQAAIGVLAAAGLFAIYWLLSGPLGFAVLKNFKRERHSWPLFVAVAFLFTAVAWAGGKLLGSTRASLRHVTFLDQLAYDPGQTDPSAGAPPQRALSFFSVYLPGYGPTRIGVGSASDSPSNLLASWSQPPSGSGDTFPNKDRYRIDASNPNNYRVPARATSADFVANWAGTVDTKWGSLISVRSPIELRIDRSKSPQQIQLVGVLSHALPGALEDVTILLVEPYRTSLPRLRPGPLPLPDPVSNGSEMPLYGRATRVTRWSPGSDLDLNKAFATADAAAGDSSATNAFNAIDHSATGLAETFLNRYYKSIPDQYSVSQFQTMNEDRRRMAMEMLSFYAMLQPPEWIQQKGQTPDVARATRLLGRDVDLSPWFTRPCLIITGFVAESPTPVPVSVEGDPIAGTGLTMVRWIYPLDWPLDMVVPDLRGAGGANVSEVPEVPEVPGTPSPSAEEPSEPSPPSAPMPASVPPRPPQPATVAPGRTRPS